MSVWAWPLTPKPIGIFLSSPSIRELWSLEIEQQCTIFHYYFDFWPFDLNIYRCKGPWVHHPYQVSSKSIKLTFWRRSWKCENLQTDDDGRHALTIAHESLNWLWWPNKRPKGPHIVHLSTMCHLFDRSARAEIFVYSSAWKTQTW